MLYLVSILKSLSKAPYILQLCELWVGWCEYNRIIWDTEYTRTISSTFVISCLGYEVAWLDQVGPVGNKIMTVIWVSVVSQISVRTSNGPCLLPNSWSGAGFYAFSFTSHIHWVIIQWRWLTQSLGPGPATSHVEISEFFIKGSMTGWIRKMWACWSGVIVVDGEKCFRVGLLYYLPGPLRLSTFPLDLSIPIPIVLPCWTCWIPKRARVDDYIILYIHFSFPYLQDDASCHYWYRCWAWLRRVQWRSSSTNGRTNKKYFKSTTPSQQVRHPQTRRVPSGQIPLRILIRSRVRAARGYWPPKQTCVSSIWVSQVSAWPIISPKRSRRTWRHSRCSFSRRETFVRTSPYLSILRRLVRWGWQTKWYLKCRDDQWQYDVAEGVGTLLCSSGSIIQASRYETNKRGSSLLQATLSRGYSQIASTMPLWMRASHISAERCPWFQLCHPPTHCRWELGGALGHNVRWPNGGGKIG